MSVAIEKVREDVGKMSVWANGLAVTTEEDYKKAFAGIRKIKAIRLEWVIYWEDLKKDAYDAWKGVVARESAGTKICDESEKTAKLKADKWRCEQERIAAEQQRKLQAIADEKARRERERLEKEAEKLKTPELKEERMEEAAAVVAPEVKIEGPAKVEGVSVSMKWKARVTDINALIKAAKPGSVASTFVEFNSKSATAFAKSTRGKVEVPGVEFYAERSTSVRRENGEE